MPSNHAPAVHPAHSRLALLAAGLATPVAILATWVIGLLLLVLGILKFLPAHASPAPDSVGAAAASTHLLLLATGGVVTTPWGPWLVGALQVALGGGLLVPPARAFAALGSLAASIVMVIGIVWYWKQLFINGSLNEAGVAMIVLTVLFLAGAALGMRHVAKRVGAAS